MIIVTDSAIYMLKVKERLQKITFPSLVSADSINKHMNSVNPFMLDKCRLDI